MMTTTGKQLLTRIIAIAVVLGLVPFLFVASVMESRKSSKILILLLVLVIFTLYFYVLFNIAKQRNTLNGQERVNNSENHNHSDVRTNTTRTTTTTLSYSVRNTTDVEANSPGNVSQNNDRRLETLVVTLLPHNIDERNVERTNEAPPGYEQVINDKSGSNEEQPPPDYTEAVKNINRR